MITQQDGPKDYKWLMMNFFTRWTENSHVFICFDAPEDVPTNFLAALRAHHGSDSGVLQPYALHAILMHILVPMYDKSIWDMSERVRGIEKVCNTSNQV
jgi:hypothetical protein